MDPVSDQSESESSRLKRGGAVLPTVTHDIYDPANYNSVRGLYMYVSRN